MKIVFTMIAGSYGTGHAVGTFQRLASGGFLDDHTNLPLMVMPVDPYDGTAGDLKPGYLDPYRGKPYEIFVEEPRKEDVDGMDERRRYAHAFKRCLRVLDEFEGDVLVILEDATCFSKNWPQWLRMVIGQVSSKHGAYWALTMSMFTPEPDKAFQFGFQWVQLNVQKGHRNAVGPGFALGAKAAGSLLKEIEDGGAGRLSRIRDAWILDERVPYYATAPSIVRYADEVQSSEETGSKYHVQGFKERLPRLRIP